MKALVAALLLLALLAPHTSEAATKKRLGKRKKVPPASVPASAPASAPVSVIYHLKSEPPGASVWLKDEKVCKETPCDYATAQATELAMRLEGREDCKVSPAPLGSTELGCALTVSVGQLSFAGLPEGAMVAIDGQAAEKSPVATKTLAVGTHTVTIDAACNETEEQKIEVARYALSTVTWKPVPKMAQVSLSVSDERGRTVAAAVAIDGTTNAGAASLPSAIPLCSAVAHVSHPDFEPVELPLHLQPGENRIAVQLVKTPEAVAREAEQKRVRLIKALLLHPLNFTASSGLSLTKVGAFTYLGIPLGMRLRVYGGLIDYQLAIVSTKYTLNDQPGATAQRFGIGIAPLSVGNWLHDESVRPWSLGIVYLEPFLLFRWTWGLPVGTAQTIAFGTTLSVYNVGISATYEVGLSGVSSVVDLELVFRFGGH